MDIIKWTFNRFCKLSLYYHYYIKSWIYKWKSPLWTNAKTAFKKLVRYRPPGNFGVKLHCNGTEPKKFQIFWVFYGYRSLITLALPILNHHLNNRFSGECSFFLNGKVNRLYIHLAIIKNLMPVQDVELLFLPSTLTIWKYLNLFNSIFESGDRHCWNFFQQDSYPPHYAMHVRQLLYMIIQERTKHMPVATLLKFWKASIFIWTVFVRLLWAVN